MNEDIKKGIRLIAFGFLFTLININLTFGNVTVNVFPDFVGWILMSMAIDPLGVYTEDRRYLKYVCMAMIVLSGALWLLGILAPDLNTQILGSVCDLISAAYIFILFESLIHIGEDNGSAYTDMLRFLRWANLAVFIAFGIIGLLFPGVDSSNIRTAAIAVIPMILIGLVVAIMTAVTLFKLNKEISSL